MESQYNNVDTTLDIAGTWNGEAELCNGYVIILVYIKSSKRCTLKVRQSDNKSNYNFIETVEYLPITGEARYQIYRSSLYCYVEVINDSGEVIPDLIVRTHFLNIGRDSSIYYPTVVAGAVDVVNFPAVQPVSGSVSIANDVTVKGINNNFEFFPTATNNTATVYADGVQGVNVNGGWSYSNLITGKINWYCYASSGLATDYKVSQLNSMYTVVNNLSTLGLTLAQNPWIMIYTRPDSGTNGASWYKSKLFFGSNAHTDTLGLKLLYTGTDPTHIHTEITGINRIQLLFVEALSTKSLALAQNETIMTGSLQTTNNTTPANSFSFTMQEFGCDWVKESTILPIEFNKVKCDISGQAVTVLSGAITETNSGTISTTLTTLNSKVTACNTGAIVVSSALPSGTNNIGKVTTIENPSSVISLSSVNATSQQIKNSPGSLQNIFLYYDNNSDVAYVKIYDALTANGTDTPKLILPIAHLTNVQLNTHNLTFNTGICIRAVTTYSGGVTNPTGTIYANCFYDGI